MSKYDVPSAKAGNIRLKLSKIVHVPPGTPVRFAKTGREFEPTERALKEGKPFDEYRCVEACTLEDKGTPAVIVRREAYVMEKNRKGQPLIVVYSKGDELTDHFDKTKDFRSYRFMLRAWPESWFPEYRAELEKSRKKSGKPVIKRPYSTRKTPQSPMRLTAVTARHV